MSLKDLKTELLEVRRDASQTLKNSRSGHLGHLNRQYKEAEELILSKDYDGLVAKLHRVNTAFSNVIAAHKLYVDSLQLDIDIELANKFLMSIETSKTEFDCRVAALQKTKKLCPRNDTSSNVGSSSSSSSSKLKEARVKKLQAQLRQKQLEQEMELKRQALELEVKQKMLEARAEEELAVAEEQVWASGSSVASSVSESCDLKRNVLKSKPEVAIDASLPDPVGHPSRSLNPDAPVFHGRTLAFGEQVVSGLIEAQRQVAETITAGFNLPKPQLQSFSGDPKDFYCFIASFDASLGSVTDPRLKLNYLIQYCDGEVKNAVRDCASLGDPNLGYNRARDILHQLYGQPHVISHRYIEDLINGQSLKQNDHAALNKLSLQMQQCQITLGQLGYDADMNNSDNLLKIVRRLPFHLRSKWADKADTFIQSGHEPRFNELANFIQRQARVANNLYGKDLGKFRDSSSSTKKQNDTHRVTGRAFATQGAGSETQPVTGGAQGATSSQGPHARTVSHTGNESRVKCPLCGQMHSLWDCGTYVQKSVEQRHSVMKENNLCNNCAQPGHFGKGCMKKGACTHCRMKHHSLLHRPGNAGGQHNSTNEETDTKVHCYATGARAESVFLRVVPVRMYGPDGFVETYAMLDSCSDVSLVSQGLVDQLGVTGRDCKFSITTVNGEAADMSGKEVSLKVGSLDGQQYVEVERAWTVEQISASGCNIPSSPQISQWPHLQERNLPQITSNKVGVLIGADVPEVFWILEERRGGRKEPCRVRTLLGWTVIGPVVGENTQRSFHVNFTSGRDVELHEQQKNMWKTDFTETTFSTEVTLSVEDKRALKIMDETINQLPNGHYQLSLPWRDWPPPLQNNQFMAEKRLHYLKRRLQKDAVLRSMYIQAVEDYLEKGYATRVPENEVQESKWYLPHHPVVHPRKPGKVRVVFDCAARFQGMSLNDQLLRGPDLGSSLVGVLTRFREGPVGVMSDIQGMFNQVRVSVKDRQYLRFLWWPEENLELEPVECCMNVHLFGATSSPSCAGHALRKTVSDHGNDFSPSTVHTVLRNMYVDDALKSLKNVPDAIQLVQELPQLLERGGFKITKWNSNSKEVMDAVPVEDRAPPVVDLSLNDTHGEKALGVAWNVVSDIFQFATVKQEQALTRRGVLSMVSTLYDPLGLVAPLVLPAKVLLQELCRKQLGWDVPLSETDVMTWRNWLSDLDKISQICMPRCLIPAGMQEPCHLQLHNFSDASQTGYGCVSYLRVVDSCGKVHVSLVMGKSRVVPLKAVIIPRLELTAAVVAVKLDRMLRHELDLDLDESVFWTDSTAVLQYIANTDRRFQTFVANRISLIHENTCHTQWRHVSTELNPGDFASRGLTFAEPQKINTWLQGPEFLMKTEEEWPQELTVPGLPEDDPEVKKSARVNATCDTTTTTVKHPLEALITHHSSWTRLRKSVAWILRCKTALLARSGGRICRQGTGELKLQELQQAECVIIKYVQHEMFPEEITQLKSTGQSQHVKSHSSLRKLDPVLADGILRVGGRLERASLQYEEKHPVILPKKGHVTDLIIRHFHEQKGHSGSNQVLAALRYMYWIINGRAAVRRVLVRCITCRKRTAPMGQQMMSPLPQNRVIFDEAPFTYTGVDYFGPILVKSGRSHVKRYGCLFTCLNSRAVHIEVAHTLETGSFLCALSRFICRRGNPKEISSDNGTNFKGGERELCDAIQGWNSHKKTSEFLLQRNINWKYNPPAASHMGGVWERLIRSVRHTLKAVLNEQPITDEALTSALAEVEKILNDRPLTSLGDNPGDLKPLTPSPILQLRSNSSLAPGLFSKEDNYGRRRWRQAQYLANLFWRRWIREYLPTLQARQKWTKPQRNFTKDDLVLIGSENVSRGQWPLGHIVEAYPDKYGLVRSVKVSTATGYLVRPVTCLCLLEGDTSANGDVEDSHGDDTTLSANNEQRTSMKDDDDDAKQYASGNVAGPARTVGRRKPKYLADYV